jgi:hypothetical protein
MKRLKYNSLRKSVKGEIFSASTESIATMTDKLCAIKTVWPTVGDEVVFHTDLVERILNSIKAIISSNRVQKWQQSLSEGVVRLSNVFDGDSRQLMK